MHPGGCLYLGTLEDELELAIERYKEFEDLELNGPPPITNFHCNIDWKENQFEGMVDAMVEELNDARSNLKELYERAKGTKYEEMATDAYNMVLVRQKAQKENISCICGNCNSNMVGNKDKDVEISAVSKSNLVKLTLEEEITSQMSY